MQGGASAKVRGVKKEGGATNCKNESIHCASHKIQINKKLEAGEIERESVMAK